MSEKIDTYWFVYIVECSDETYYTGISNDIKSRIEKHNTGKGAIYTRGRRPVKLLYFEKFLTHREAAQRECAIKKINRQQKKELIQNI